MTNLSSVAWLSGIVVARKNALIARQDRVQRALDRKHEEDPLVAREPPVDPVVNRGAGEEAREDCVHCDQRAHDNLPIGAPECPLSEGKQGPHGVEGDHLHSSRPRA